MSGRQKKKVEFQPPYKSLMLTALYKVATFVIWKNCGKTLPKTTSCWEWNRGCFATSVPHLFTPLPICPFQQLLELTCCTLSVSSASFFFQPCHLTATWQGLLGNHSDDCMMAFWQWWDATAPGPASAVLAFQSLLALYHVWRLRPLCPRNSDKCKGLPSWTWSWGSPPVGEWESIHRGAC